MNKNLKFRELAEKRVSNAIKTIQLIGNLSNTSAYEYSEEDVKKIFKILREEIGISEARFKSKNKGSSFKL